MSPFIAAIALSALVCPPYEPRPVVQGDAYRVLPAAPGSVPVEEPWASPARLRDALERDILRWTNVERLARGLSPLAWSAPLARAARAHSEEMVRLGYFGHTSPVPRNRSLLQRVRNAGLRASTLRVGENLARGTWRSGRARSIVRAWMRSPSHRDNLLDASFRFLGVGVAEDGAALVVTQNFGSRG